MLRKVTKFTAMAGLCLTAVGGARIAAAPAMPTASSAPELFIAIGKGDVSEVKSLLAGGVNANTRNSLGMTALMWAAPMSPEIVTALIAAGADVNATSLFGNALSFACLTGNGGTIRILLPKTQNLENCRTDRMTILMLAARTAEPEIIKQLLDRKVQLHTQDNSGATALSHAAREGRLDVVQLLLAAGARPQVADAAGWTSLMHAAVNGRTAVVSALLRAGAAVDTRDKAGRTALLLTAGLGDHPDVVRTLVEGGASLKLKDAQGRTPLALAQLRGFNRTAMALQEKGAAREAATSRPRTPQQAVLASLPKLEHSMDVFTRRTGCVSCHHEGLGRWATGVARSRGYQTSAMVNQGQLRKTLGMMKGLQPLHQAALGDPKTMLKIPVMDIGDIPPTYGEALAAQAAHGIAPAAPLRAAAEVLARTQHPDGAWRFGLPRVPLQSSHFTMTAMAIRALKTYGVRGEVTTAQIEKARGWLASAPVVTTEDRAMRLLGLKWAGASAEQRQQPLLDLIATQRPDGGWSQEGEMASDAYATGSALYALAQGGDLPVSDAVYRKGVAFLLRTQQHDGTWFVFKRAVPANDYFDAEFPYGQSQYASFAGTAWATMALSLADKAPTVPRLRTTRRTAAR